MTESISLDKPNVALQGTGEPVPLLLRMREKIPGEVAVNPGYSDHPTYSGATQTPSGDIYDYETD